LPVQNALPQVGGCNLIVSAQSLIQIRFFLKHDTSMNVVMCHSNER